MKGRIMQSYVLKSHANIMTSVSNSYLNPKTHTYVE